MDPKFTKSGLAIQLSKFKIFTSPKVSLEQYPTDPEIAAEVLWNAHLLGDISAKVSVDLGAGTGILGLGSLLLGAKSTILVESERSALDSAHENYQTVQKTLESESSRAQFLSCRIEDFEGHGDVVLQNPPFGTKVRHADREFLEKAVSIAPIIYSFHKTETKAFITRFAAKHGCSVTHRWDFDFPLKVSMKHHRKPKKFVKVSCFRLKQ